MTREECIALLDRYANYNGMGIPNLTGCKDAMKKAVELLSEKPSEDLEKEIDKRYLQNRVVGYVDGVGEIILGREAFGRIARHFAEWQKEQFEKNRLAACDNQTKEEYDRETAFVEEILKEHRQPTFSDAINYGMRLQKEQMLKDAVKDTTERAIAWLKEHANDYIVDLTPTYPDAPVNIVVGGKCWIDLKEYLED